jgi:hypothetical protein
MEKTKKKVEWSAKEWIMDSNHKVEEIVNKTLHTRLLIPTLKYIIS